MDRSALAVATRRLLLASCFLLPLPASAQTYQAIASGINETLPSNGSAGNLTITKPSGTTTGEVMLATLSARPSGMTITAPSGWTLYKRTEQPNGGSSTSPGGMSLLTYFKKTTAGEPSNYTWTLANLQNDGGGAAGSIIRVSGVDTVNPIDVYVDALTANGTTHSAPSVTTTVANTLLVAAITYLSSRDFSTPTGITGITQRAEMRAPSGNDETGVSLLVATAGKATAGASGSVSATAAGDDDYGMGHMFALAAPRPDLRLTMSRSAALTPGSSASYTLTVDNLGTVNESGTVTVVNTLPANVSYTNNTGSASGWTCNSTGTPVIVTCTRSGLNSGTSSALVLNVAVSTVASGTAINTASVSGTANNDGDSSNNAASDSYTIAAPSGAYAYYKLDETSWGTITDASGNGRNASKLGTAAPTGYPPAATPGSAIAGSTGSCGSASIPASTSAIGIDTGININSVGNSGTIAFWFNSNAAWNTGADRMLFDASRDTGNLVILNASDDKMFYLAKQSNGSLLFALQDNTTLLGYGGIVSTATTGVYSFAANTWHHIAVTWALGSDRTRIYVDGSLAATSTTGTNGSLGTLTTLYLGSARGGSVFGTPGGYSANSANGYIDEVYIYGRELTAAEILQTKTTPHFCGSNLDHVRLDHGGSGVTCVGSSVTVTACSSADSVGTCTANSSGLSGNVIAKSSGGSTLATVPFSIAAGSSSVAVTVPVTTAQTASFSTNGLSTMPSASQAWTCWDGTAASCSHIYSDSGFIFSSSAGGAATSITTQIAGTTSATYVLRAVKTNPVTRACDAALSGVKSVNFAYECDDPASCYASNLLSINGAGPVTVARNNHGSVTNYTSVDLNFDTNGNAPFTLNYSDVGLIKLYASKAPSGTLLTTLTGASNSFVVKPFGFTVTGIKCTIANAANCAPGALALTPAGSNPAAADVNGASFIGAGRAFTATVTAKTATGSVAFSYGREAAAEGVLLSSALVAPSGGSAGTFSGGTIAGGSFGSGVATVTNLSWNEAGIIGLTPSVADADYLGAGNVTGTASGNIGRFIPDHLVITGGTGTPACSNAFTYFGQDGLITKFTLTAQSLSNTTTTNYSTAIAWAKLPLTTWQAAPATTGSPGYGFSAATLPSGATLSASATAPTVATCTSTADFACTTGSASCTSNVPACTGSGLPVPVFSSGVANVWVKHKVNRPAAPTGITSLTISATPVDSDGVTMSSTAVAAASNFYFGRLWLGNAYGSDKFSLDLPYEVQYWNGSAFVRNDTDGCTSLSTANIGLGNQQGGMTAYTGSVTPSSTVSGAGKIKLAAPSGAMSGSVDLVVTLGSGGSPSNCGSLTSATSAGMSYLSGKWCGSNYDRDPTARATFGVYGSSAKKGPIYVRESY